jgi:hypothetical protein
MAFPDYGRTLFAPKGFGDLNVVLIKIQDTAIVAGESSPECTVTAAGSGVYNLTFPKAQVGWVLSAKHLAVGSATAEDAELTAFSATAGTATVDTGSDMSGGDQCHVCILLGAN